MRPASRRHRCGDLLVAMGASAVPVQLEGAVGRYLRSVCYQCRIFVYGSVDPAIHGPPTRDQMGSRNWCLFNVHEVSHPGRMVVLGLSGGYAVNVPAGFYEPSMVAPTGVLFVGGGDGWRSRSSRKGASDSWRHTPPGFHGRIRTLTAPIARMAGGLGHIGAVRAARGRRDGILADSRASGGPRRTDTGGLSGAACRTVAMRILPMCSG